MLVASDYAQLDMILNPAFDARCLRELRFLPYRSLRRLSPTQIEATPNDLSLQDDAMDPLDP